MIKAIKFVGIPVRNQDQALDFYTRKLGFTVLTDQPFTDAQRWIELKVPGAETGVVLFTPEGHENRIGAFQSVSFWTRDVRQTYEELQQRGVTFDAAPVTADWGTSAIFRDQDGNGFVLGTKD